MIPETSAKKGQRIQFAGPVKILVIEARGEYWKTICFAVAVGLTHLMIGATNMTLFLYTLSTEDFHVILCGCAFHLFSAEAILALNYVNGWSTPMRSRHRTYIHMTLHILAVIFVCIGATKILSQKGISTITTTAHGIISLVAMVLMSIAVFFGPILLECYNRTTHTIHTLIGVAAFVTSSASLLSGIFRPAFSKWAYHSVQSILLAFVLFTTTVIALTAIYRFISRMF